MLVELSKSQDMVAGDGTTTVVVICGSLLKKSLGLLSMGVHATLISDAFQQASDKACEILQNIAIPVDIQDRNALIQAAETSLCSKVVSQYSSIFAPLAVDAITKVVDKEKPGVVDLRDIKVITKMGSLIDDSALVDGVVFDQKASYIASSITKVENAKIALIQFQISPPKTDMENNVIVSDYQQMDKILREERNYILQIIKKIRAVGCNVLLIQKSILRDAVTDLSLHYLAKAKIMVVKDVERDDIEFITKTLGCLPITHVDHMKPEKLAHAELVQEVDMGNSKIVKVSGIQNPGKTSTILLRGANKLMVEEAERSLHDALCVIRCLVQQPYLLPGGSAPEMEVTHQLSVWSKTVKGMESYCARDFAEALEVVPYTLAENAGLNPIQIVSQLRNLHSKGEKNYGINVKKGSVTDMLQEKVVQPLLVTKSAIQLATECVRMILKIDDIVPTR
eukprot:TRINITY_DN5353_c0_g1_i1.p1 TRINITY_DN5353_c0_g1~~TRINITY_DN5353_c0_g1_i1.p1  ORF type:complete len:489 (-),score=59.03 TRINITY_DN5353_c0_g1_i1:395-1750(-)